MQTTGARRLGSLGANVLVVGMAVLAVGSEETGTGASHSEGLGGSHWGSTKQSNTSLDSEHPSQDKGTPANFTDLNGYRNINSDPAFSIQNDLYNI